MGISHRHGWPPDGVGLISSLILVCVLVYAAAGSAAEPDSITISVHDEQGKVVTSGVVLICPEDAPCFEFTIEAGGSIQLNRTVLELDTIYAVLIYAEDLSLRYAASEWTYDSTVDLAAAPELRGRPAQGLQVTIPPLRAPVPDQDPTSTQPAVAVTDPEIYPRFGAAVLVPVMLGGNFGTDPTALGGVTDVSPGFGLMGSYRFGFPRHQTLGRSSVAFKELSLIYAQNRYQVDPIEPTGKGSDLTFHRFLLSFGLGRLWRQSQASLAVAAGYGGLYDGGTLVEFRDRTYGMFGLGLQTRYVHRILGRDGGVTVGLLGQLEVMYYFAEPGEDDHWYGWAPSAAIGVAVY